MEFVLLSCVHGYHVYGEDWIAVFRRGTCLQVGKLPHDLVPHGGKEKRKGEKEGPTITKGIY